MKPGQEQAAGKEENQHVLPKDDHLRVEEVIQRNAPGAFRAPERGAERDQPRAVPEVFAPNEALPRPEVYRSPPLPSTLSGNNYSNIRRLSSHTRKRCEEQTASPFR